MSPDVPQRGPGILVPLPILDSDEWYAGFVGFGSCGYTERVHAHRFI